MTAILPLDPGDLLGLPGVLGSFRASLDFGALDISPDGGEAVFSWNVAGSYDLYTLALRGGDPGRLTNTPSASRSMHPRYSPLGDRIAFLRDRDGDERFHIWVVDRATGEEQQLTSTEANREAIEWSADGLHLVYRAHSAGGLGIWMLDAGSGDERPVVTGVRDPGSDHVTPDISHDGRHIVFHAAAEEDPADVGIWVVPSDGSAPPRRLPTHEGARARAVLPRWGPGDDSIAFTTDTRGRFEVALLPMSRAQPAGEVRYLTDAPHDETALGWGPTGRMLYRQSTDSTIRLLRADPATGAGESLVAGPGVCFAAREARDGTVAYVWTSPTAPPELYTRAPGEEAQQRTWSLPAGFDRDRLTPPDHVWYPGADGSPTPALLYVPRSSGAGPQAAIVWAHGGGTWQHLQCWDPIPQWLTGHGYVVLAPNARGSRGYGRAHREGNVGDWGGKDLEDHVRGADWLEATGVADGSRIGMYGSSGGGYMTSIALTCAPDRFAAGVTSCGIVSLETFYRSTRADLRGMVRAYMGSPDEDPQLFHERSPLTHIDRIQAPLLVLHGGTDPRVPASEAALLVEALRVRGIIHDYHVYPDEGHGFRDLANQSDALRRIVAWFDQHLRGRAAPPPPPT